MRVVHPRAIDDEGPPPASVDIRGETVGLDDEDTFECDDEGWLRQFATAHGVDLETIVIEESQFTSASAENLADENWQTVVSEIESGEVDDLLDELEDIDDRDSVQEAIEDRRAELKD